MGAFKIDRDVAIFDLDGCLFDDSWRLYLISQAREAGLTGDKMYERYHDHLHADLPINTSVEVLHKHMRAGHKIIFITARPATRSIVAQTQESLKDKLGIILGDGPDHAQIVFRPQGNEEPSPTIKMRALLHIQMELKPGKKIVAAYDDRQDVVDMYISQGVNGLILSKDMEPAKENFEAKEGEQKAERSSQEFGQGVSDIMRNALETWESRNGDYKYNAITVANVMKALFPNGVELNSPGDFHMFHLFELQVVKLSRFANSGLKHADSARDGGIYAFMCENLVNDHSIITNKKGSNQ